MVGKERVSHGGKGEVQFSGPFPALNLYPFMRLPDKQFTTFLTWPIYLEPARMTDRTT